MDSTNIGATKEADEARYIGEAGKPIYAFAFRGGGFDTIMQLGVAHALLLLGDSAPHVVAGISAGALNAAALAEILQAGASLEPVARKGAQVAKLREFFDAYRSAPRELARYFVPDPYEVEARAPLESLKLPLHAPRERDQREEAVAGLSGMIRLINDLLGLGISIGLLTQIIRRWMMWVAAADEPNPFRQAFKRFLTALAVWIAAPFHFYHVAPLFRLLLTLPFPQRADKGRSAGSLMKPGRRYMRAIATALGNLAGLVIVVVVWVLGTLLVFYQLLAPFLKMMRRWIAKALRLDVQQGAVTGRVRHWLVRRILLRYDLSEEIGSEYGLQQLLIRMFDPEYDGELRMRRVVEGAIAKNNRATKRTPKEARRVGVYAKQTPAIHVAPIAADIRTGKLHVVSDRQPLVDGLLAATAVVPFFRPVPAYINGSPRQEYCIDGMNVANEPTAALISHLRTRAHPDATKIVVYPVAAFPTESTSHGEENDDGLVGTVLRVMHLRRYQAATLERKLTKLYTRLLPQGKARTSVDGKDYISVDICPIEPKKALGVNEQLLTAGNDGNRQRIMAEAIACGCRATIEALLLSSEPKDTQQPRLTRCDLALAGNLRSGLVPLPGSASANGSPVGPGLAEICAHCTFQANGKPEKFMVHEIARGWPKWGSPLPVEVRADRSLPPARPESEKPWVTVLLSGGVFRGVFQMGVLNALNEAGMTPRAFAGSSVGSIMAAMCAAVFDQEGQVRYSAMAELAATFLALDRLVLTDRFSDFIRRFTLRASATRFSLRDADRLFRRYDDSSTDLFGRRARRVIAGIERLFYVSPYELQELVKALRYNNSKSVYQQLKHHLQEFLSRYGVDSEILGAEPLALLIGQHVLSGRKATKDSLLDLFGPDAYLIATATDLQNGALKVISSANGGKDARLVETLLASSAFPGVFRPRRSSEVFPLTPATTQFVDGGVMDNLPLDAVAEFLHESSRKALVARRPLSGTVPHAIIAASLEPDLEVLDRKAVAAIAQHWPSVLSRARQLTYNKKLQSFQSAQREFRAIYKEHQLWEPVDIEVVKIVPKWLCSTFGFHPMLGFRRLKQAQSIAHGCALTLVELFRQPPEWRQGWEIKLDDFDEKSFTREDDRVELLVPQPRKDGGCWFRKEALCPFSGQGMLRNGVTKTIPEPSATADALRRIYDECGRASTHIPAR